MQLRDSTWPSLALLVFIALVGALPDDQEYAGIGADVISQIQRADETIASPVDGSAAGQDEGGQQGQEDTVMLIAERDDLKAQLAAETERYNAQHRQALQLAVRVSKLKKALQDEARRRLALKEKLSNVGRARGVLEQALDAAGVGSPALGLPEASSPGQTELFADTPEEVAALVDGSISEPAASAPVPQPPAVQRQQPPRRKRDVRRQLGRRSKARPQIPDVSFKALRGHAVRRLASVSHGRSGVAPILVKRRAALRAASVVKIKVPPSTNPSDDDENLLDFQMQDEDQQIQQLEQDDNI